MLHWHIVDDQSFPLQIQSLPLLQQLGACVHMPFPHTQHVTLSFVQHDTLYRYSLLERYSHSDVVAMVEYARDRGIRVMLEIDTPRCLHP